MNVLYINHTSKISGAEKVLIDLFTKLDREKFTPIVACPKNGELVKKIKLLGIETVLIKIKVLKRTLNPLYLILFIFAAIITTIKLTYLIKLRNVKLIHANSFTACLFSSIAGIITHTPLVWHMHDLITPRLFNRIFIRSAGLMANRVIATTETMKNNLVMTGVNPEKIVVNCCGINLRKYNPTSTNRGKIREEFNISEDAPLIGIIGQLTPWKGHREFLKAASIVIRKYPSAKFLIVGESIFEERNYKLELQELVNTLALSAKVIFSGFREDVPDIMASLSILVNASCSEPFGLTIIEAMAIGKPVVATNAGGVREIINDGVDGILVPPKDPEKLAQAILRILDEPMRGKEMGEAGLKSVTERFSLERFTQETQRIYDQLLGQS